MAVSGLRSFRPARLGIVGDRGKAGIGKVNRRGPRRFGRLAIGE
jgi:hypothetical protein